MYLDSSDLELMSDGGEQVVLVMFPTADVPAGATIASAQILFDIDEVRPGQSDQDCTISISGELGSSALPTATSADVSSRTTTGAAVLWQPPVSVSTHDDLWTPDLSSVVSEIVNDGSWAAGNNMGFNRVSAAAWGSSFSSEKPPPRHMMGYSTGSTQGKGEGDGSRNFFNFRPGQSSQGHGDGDRNFDRDRNYNHSPRDARQDRRGRDAYDYAYNHHGSDRNYVQGLDF